MTKRDLSPIAAYVGLAYVISWTIWLTGIFRIKDLTSISDGRFFWFLFAGSFAPTAGALMVAGVSGGGSAMKRLLRGFLVVKVHWRVYVVTFFLLPVMGIATYLALGIDHKVSLSAIGVTAVVLMPLNAILGGIVFGIGPLGEELGWRGFLQGRLQGKGRSVVIAVVIGLLWAVWHFPLAFCFADFRSGLSLGEFVVLYPVFTILLAFIMGHLWRWSNGSLLIAVFFHAVSNMTVDVYLMNANWWDFGGRTPLQIYLTILLVFVLMASVTELLSRRMFTRPYLCSKREIHVSPEG